MTDDIDEIREQKRRELIDRAQRSADDDHAPDPETDNDAKRDALLKQILTEDARKRLKTVSLVHEDRATAVENQLLAYAQQGRLSEKVTDDQLKAILKNIADSDSNSFDIRRR